eukprot:872268_1
MAEFKEQLQNVDHVDHTRKQSFQEATMDRSDASDIDHNDSGMTSLSQPNVLRDELTRTDEHTNDTKPSNEPKHRHTKKERTYHHTKKERRYHHTKKKQKIPPHQKAKKISMGKKGDIQYTVGDRIRLTKDRNGTIRYIGKPHFCKEAAWIGIELDKRTTRGHDGTVDKFRYFDAKYGHGIFVTQDVIIEKLKSRDNDGTSGIQLEIGDDQELDNIDNEAESIIASMNQDEIDSMQQILRRYYAYDNDHNEVQHLLMERHKMMNLSGISDILHFVHPDNTKTQLLSFIFDAYSLIRYNQLRDNNLKFENMLEFVNTYPLFAEQVVRQYKSNIVEDKTDDLFTNIYNQYCASFGKPISMKPKIKIQDSIYVFISYIVGMNAAIKQYITPKPLQCPLVIDFWIIPNHTTRADHGRGGVQQEIDNDIGNIKQRLDRNKVTYIKKRCYAEDTQRFTRQINHCLSAPKIQKAMKKDKICRLIFIVDRRYKKRDSLYCIVPPIEYGQFVANASYDILNLSHWYCSSNYLLPHASESDAGIRDTHIGSTSYLNGYMFNLSYLIYEFQSNLNSEDEDQYDANESTENAKQNADDNNAEQTHNDMNHDDIINAVRHDSSNNAKHDIDHNIEQKQNHESIGNDVRPIRIETHNYGLQMSTANVKIMFSTQGMTIRFLPHQIHSLYPTYFVVPELEDDLSKIVHDLFALNLYDAYFHFNDSDQLPSITKHLKLETLTNIHPDDDIRSSNDKLSEQCQSWEKTCCQIRLAARKINHQLSFLKQTMNLNIEIRCPWNAGIDSANEYSGDILIESTDYSRPHIKLSNDAIDDMNLMRSIYDCIVWHKAQIEHSTPATHIEEYINSNMSVSEAIQDVANRNAVISKIIKYDKVYNGSTFLTNNLGLLIDDGIVPYAYYLSILSHIMNSMTNCGNFEFFISFICPRIVSATGHIAKSYTVDLDAMDLKREHFTGQRSLQQDFDVMVHFLHNAIGMNVENQKLCIIVDRRQSKSGSTEATIYFYASSRNLSHHQPVPNIHSLSNPHLFHIRFHHFQQLNETVAYFVRNNCSIRFFPELMMKIWPLLFYGDSKFIRDTVYEHQLRHSFAFPLYDQQFTRNYYALFNRKFISINYYRSISKTQNVCDIDTTTFRDNLIKHLASCNIYNELQQLTKWIDDDEYDTDAVQMDIYGEALLHRKDNLKLEPEFETSNVALFVQRSNGNKMFATIAKFTLCVADVDHFNALIAREKCDWKPDSNLLIDYKFIEDCKVEELVNIMSDNIFDRLGDPVLNKLKQKILKCFHAKTINGSKLKSMKCGAFCDLIASYCEDTPTLKSSLKRLYTKSQAIVQHEISIRIALTHCAAIDRISFISFKYTKEDIENTNLFDIFNATNYTIIDLMDDICHLFQHHHFIANNVAYKLIKRYIIGTKRLKHCVCDNNECDSMQRHCRNRDFVQKTQITDKHLSTWIVLLDQIHCPLFHDKSIDFRHRYQQTDQCQSSVYPHKSKNKFPELQFGVNVDEWLPSGYEPRFGSMQHEILFNDYVKLDHDTLQQMKYETKHRHLSSSNEQYLNEEELLALKVFTDIDKLQKEFSKSFWKAQFFNKSLIVRRQQFYHWAHTLRRAFKYGNVPINQTLYRGFNKTLQIASFSPFCGQPTSTSTNWNVANGFSDGVGLIIESDKNQVVYGLDVLCISIYPNESEIWLYDQTFPLQRAAISVLNDEQTKIDFISSHLINVPHPLKSIVQFLAVNEPNAMIYIQKMMQNEALLSTITKHQNLNVFERLFFEWRHYSLTAPTLDSFENMIGNVTLRYKDGYFYIHGIRAIIIELFVPTSFHILYSNNNIDERLYDVNVGKLSHLSEHLLSIASTTLQYRFKATFSNTNQTVKPRELLTQYKTTQLSRNDITMIQQTVTNSITKEENVPIDTNVPDPIIRTMDGALKKYYESVNAVYEMNDDDIGLFEAYCVDNDIH